MTTLHDRHAIPALEELVHKALTPLDGPPRPMCGEAGRSVVRSEDVTCPACRGEVDAHRETAPEIDLDATLPADPSDLLAAAIAATITAQTTPSEEHTEDAVAAVAAYCTAAGLNGRVETADRILTAIETARRSPSFSGSGHDIAVAHFWAQENPRDMAARYRDGRGKILRPTLYRRQFRLLPDGGRVRLTVRQATRHGLLVRVGGAA